MNYNKKLNAIEIWRAISDTSIESTSLSGWNEQSQHAPNILIAKEWLNHTDTELTSYRGGKVGIEKHDTLLDAVMMKKNKFLFSVLIDRNIYLENLPEISHFINDNKHLLLQNNYEVYHGYTLESLFYEAMYSTTKQYRSYLNKVMLNKKGYPQSNLDEEEKKLNHASITSWFEFFSKLDKDNSEIKNVYQNFINQYVKPYWSEVLFENVHIFSTLSYINELPNFALEIDLKNEKNQTLLDLHLLDKYHPNNVNSTIECEKVKLLLSLGVEFDEYPKTLKEHVVLSMLKSNSSKVHEAIYLLLPYCKDLKEIENEALSIMDSKDKHFNGQIQELFKIHVERNKLESNIMSNTNSKKMKL